MSNLENLQHRHSKSLLSKKETAKELNISQATLDRLQNLERSNPKKLVVEFSLPLTK
ncbi:hypothetical protein NG754_10325 [Aliarcobacter cryaerophilus]|uniref:hypothetical protein n=1 Tax=Aliarcobacter cryaerophilus TaxID=28198 RepID=UPI003DA4F1CF